MGQPQSIIAIFLVVWLILAKEYGEQPYKA